MALVSRRVDQCPVIRHELPLDSISFRWLPCGCGAATWRLLVVLLYWKIPLLDALKDFSMEHVAKVTVFRLYTSSHDLVVTVDLSHLRLCDSVPKMKLLK